MRLSPFGYPSSSGAAGMGSSQPAAEGRASRNPTGSPAPTGLVPLTGRVGGSLARSVPLPAIPADRYQPGQSNDSDAAFFVNARQLRALVQPTMASAQTQATPAAVLPAGAEPKVTMFDEFAGAESPTVTTHGEIVEPELRRNQPDLDLSKSEVRIDRNTQGIAQGKPGALDDYLKSQFLTPLNGSVEAWSKALDAPEQPDLVQQSQGASQSRAVENLWGRSLRDEAFRHQLESQLGVPSSGGSEMSPEEKKRLLGALLTRSDAIHKHDPQIREAVDKLRGLQEQAGDEGIIHVISAGNQGGLDRQIRELGLEPPKGFFTNELASDDSIIVGAADDGTNQANSGRPAGVAGLASPEAGADIAADGINRPVVVNGRPELHHGSSVATPQVSSIIVDMLRENPNLSRDQILERLTARAQPIVGQESYVGAGVVSYG